MSDSIALFDTDYKIFTFYNRIEVLTNGKKFFKYVNNDWKKVHYVDVKDYFTKDDIRFNVDFPVSYFKIRYKEEMIKYSIFMKSDFSDMKLIGYRSKKNDSYLTDRARFTGFSSNIDNMIVFSNLSKCSKMSKYVNLKYPNVILEKIKCYNGDITVLERYRLSYDGNSIFIIHV